MQCDKCISFMDYNPFIFIVVTDGKKYYSTYCPNCKDTKWALISEIYKKATEKA